MNYCFKFLVINRLYGKVNKENQGQKQENLATSHENF